MSDEKVIKEQYLISPFLSFFIIHAMQVGVGVLGFQRMVVEESGYDAWISVLLSGVMVAISIACMYALLKRADGDIIKVHQQLFGKWVGGILSTAIGLYFFFLALIIFRTYLEVLQLWMFEDLQTWFIAILSIPFFYYVVSGGFRTVVGLAFVSILITLPIYPLFLMTLEFAHYINILPVWKHSFTELFLGAKASTFSYSGFELLLIYYPFLKKKEFSQKWTQLGGIFTTLLYTYIMLICLFFYSEEQINKTVWATLTLFKVIEFPFLERFEYIGITMWMIVCAPNIALAIWAASRMVKRVFEFNQRHVLIVFVFMLAGGIMLLPTRQEINMITDIFSEIGFYFAFAYIPLLLLLQIVVYKVKKKGAQNETTSM
ncbi:GerAB/ArcD/ProY family transporter [Alkalihalobacillus pseudalcaliphilus]|uniref:GerAB/ArcD/ProY family transporter n=1 Tax=Alkalihalobacillus pseudalcaliphilus TaxID=79884 RepID=UPI00064D8539|nr:GerAB/ArcD/ProY family transporter [Alkalihalobacillus pseudalcaliphilus]KMK76487.1 spore gernimation protein GerB [Alkalihalobacillus pseudalcaliphilus]